MERQTTRARFEQVAAALDPAAYAAAMRAHDLETLARGLARPETKRAATSYTLDDARVLRLLRHFELLERRATAELLALQKAFTLPADLVALRGDQARAADRLQRLVIRQRESQTRLATLSAGRPSGLWSRVTGVTRMHDQRLERARKTCARRAGDVELASIQHRAAEARLLAPEERWARESRKIEGAREQQRRDRQADLDWVADARRVVTANRDLAFASQEEFAAAVDARRAERARSAETEMRLISMTPRGPGFRP
jgi:hypothetical protein